jgi:hypothetical protein
VTRPVSRLKQFGWILLAYSAHQRHVCDHRIERAEKPKKGRLLMKNNTTNSAAEATNKTAATMSPEGRMPAKKRSTARTGARSGAKKGPGARKATKKPAAKRGATTARKGSKTDQVLALLQQPSGASLQAIMKATGWQAHSVRGFVSGHLGKKLGLRVKSVKRDGERVYSVPK